MANIVDVVVLVDADGLKATYPYGVPYGSLENVDGFMTLLTRPDNAYTDPNPAPGVSAQGIQCNVNDILIIRAMPRALQQSSVLVAEFADHADASSQQDSLATYFSLPSFSSASVPSYQYKAQGRTQVVPRAWSWGGSEWTIYQADVIGVSTWPEKMDAPTSTRPDPAMSFRALQPTKTLANNHIRFALGFDIAWTDGSHLGFYFDPYIKIK